MQQHLLFENSRIILYQLLLYCLRAQVSVATCLWSCLLRNVKDAKLYQFPVSFSSLLMVLGATYFTCINPLTTSSKDRLALSTINISIYQDFWLLHHYLPCCSAHNLQPPTCFMVVKSKSYSTWTGTIRRFRRLSR